MPQEYDNLTLLAHYYNEQYVFMYLENFTPSKVNLQVIATKRLGRNTFDIAVFDTIMRASTLIKAHPQAISSTEMKEIKWEGSLHEWWEAVADSAKQMLEVK